MMRLVRPVLVLLGALALAAPGAVAAQEAAYVPPPEELALAREIIAVMYPADKRDEMLLEMSTNLAKQAMAGGMDNPVFREPGIKAIMDRFVADLPEVLRPAFVKHMPQIFEATAVAYTRLFTLEELRDIRAFAGTPSGQRYFASTNQVMSDPAIAAANAAYFAEVMPLPRQMGAKVRKEVEDYLKANPEVLERLAKAGVGQKP
ncbi:hypothetical protein ACLBKU_08800 [Erythrobacter sp. NE805]|uniref:hypothetical protein n=1 Tax=Erythrobacter sp. NE805 TaxID=3389875 RepID=UPI00396B044E